MFGFQFYNQTLRRYIVMFGNMFNDIVIQRLDSAGTTIQSIGVPIAYGPKEKWLVRISKDPNLDQEVSIQVPRLAFDILSFTYDPTRKLQSTQKNVAILPTDTDKALYQYTPVPYNINMALYIFVQNADDGAQILEQILPFFAPEWTNNVITVPALDIRADIPTVLNDVSLEDTYQGDFLTRRALVYTLSFTIKAYFYGPVRNSGIIKRVQVDLMAVSGAGEVTDEEVTETGRSHRIVITPGLTADGNPTTNSAASISSSLISANSNFGIASNTFFFTDGLKYDPISGSDK